MSDDHEKPTQVEVDTDILYGQDDDGLDEKIRQATQVPLTAGELRRGLVRQEYPMGSAVPVEHGPNPATMLADAMRRGLSLEALDRFMSLYERWRAEESRRAFFGAMARFHAELPEIPKDGHVCYKTNSGETIEYDHPTLAGITNTVNPILGRHGLAFTWKVQQAEQIVVTVQVFHEDGHVETTTLFGAPDNSGKKNAIQQVGSTITYLERYTLQAALGIATTAPEEDDDGIGSVSKANEEPLSVEQAKTLKELLRLTGKDVKQFLEYAGGYPSVDEIPAILYSRLHLRLNERLEKMREAGLPTPPDDAQPQQQNDGWGEDAFSDLKDEQLSGDRDE